MASFASSAPPSGNVIPGDRLGSASQYAAGPGTFEDEGVVVACLCGTVTVDQREGGGARALISVSRPPTRRPAAAGAGAGAGAEIALGGAGGGRAVTLKVGDIVTARVKRVNQHACDLEIVCVGVPPAPLPRLASFAGTLRKENVRANDVDGVKMHECFRPADHVRAEVISLGDTRRTFYLSTAKNTLGVVAAVSGGGGAKMTPVSWNQMKCPFSGAVESRKVAKPATID